MSIVAISVRVDVEPLRLIRSRVPIAEAWAADRAKQHIWQSAQVAVPVDTGYLWSTILGKQQGGAFEVEASAFYSIFVEFGTSKMGAQPYMRPSFESVPWSAIIDGSLAMMGV
jgi:HK97 gp10 family phage protein